MPPSLPPPKEEVKKPECNICEICGFEAANQAKLERHQNSHMEITKHKCLDCNKAFTQAQSLANHMQIHTGEKPFVCELCGQKYRILEYYHKLDIF